VKKKQQKQPKGAASGVQIEVKKKKKKQQLVSQCEGQDNWCNIHHLQRKARAAHPLGARRPHTHTGRA